MACGMQGNPCLPDLPPKTHQRKGMDARLMQITVPGNADAVRHALRDLAASPLFDGLAQDLRSTAEIVLAEVLNNIVEHAYAARQGEIGLVIDRKAQGLACEISDSGAPMPGLCLPKGQFQPLGLTEDLPEGGFGWFLIRNLTEKLEYHHANGVNRLSFTLISEQSAVGEATVSN